MVAGYISKPVSRYKKVLVLILKRMTMYLEYLCTSKFFELSIFFTLPAIYSSGNGTMNSESLE